MLKEGMCIEQVDSIMYEFGYTDGYNRHGEYVRTYKDIYAKNNKRNGDFEGLTIIFDKNNRIIQMEESYKRTTTTMSYY